MGWHTMPSYSIEDAALLSAGIDPADVDSYIGHAKSRNYPGWQEAYGWHKSILSAIRTGELLPQDDRVFFANSSKSQGPYIPDLDRDRLIDCFKTEVSRTELRRWFAHKGMARYFLFNAEERDIAKKEGFEQAELTFLFNETMAIEALKRKQQESALSEAGQMAPADLPPHLQEIQRLLDGTHRCQAPELQLALQAWLAVSGNADDNGELAGSGVKKAPGTEIERWLSDKGYNAKTEGQGKMVPRIKAVANWNKKK